MPSYEFSVACGFHIVRTAFGDSVSAGCCILLHLAVFIFSKTGLDVYEILAARDFHDSKPIIRGKMGVSEAEGGHNEVEWVDYRCFFGKSGGFSFPCEARVFLFLNSPFISTRPVKKRVVEYWSDILIFSIKSRFMKPSS